MSSIRFERKRRKKGYLIPLVVIVLLLYFMIPIFLINKGRDLLEKAESKMNQNNITSPPVEFYNGIAFLKNAAAFPGFGKWSENVVEESTENIANQQSKQFKKLLTNIFGKELNLNDSIEVKFDSNDKSTFELINFTEDTSKVHQIALSDSLLNIIDSTFCKPWKKFVNKTKIDQSRIHSFCKK